MGDVEVTATVHAETSLSPSRTPLEEVDGAHSDGDKASDETKLSDSSAKRPSMSSSSSCSENNFNPEAHEFVPKPEDSADESPPPPPSCCVWVGNVCPEISQEDFEAAFRKYGNVKLVRMFPRSRCAFVTFETPEQALASQSLEDNMLGTMRLTLNVGRASRHLWIGNIGPSVDEDTLKKEFLPYGTVESVRVLRANKCAFVNLSSEEEALKAAENLNGRKVGEHEIVINFQWNDSERHGYSARGRGRCSKQRSSRVVPEPASPKSASSRPKTVQRNFNAPSKQLFVGNIDQAMRQDMLWAIFAQFGEIHRIKRFSDRGYAFIIFRNLSDAIWAREQLSIYPPVIHNRVLDINFGRLRDKDNGNRHMESIASSPPMVLSNQPPAPIVSNMATAPTFFYYPVPGQPVLPSIVTMPFPPEILYMSPTDATQMHSNGVMSIEQDPSKPNGNATEPPVEIPSKEAIKENGDALESPLAS